MCGIVGISSRQPVVDRSVLVAMRDAMTARGPDDAGVWWAQDSCLGLAHRRLAILDLSPAGHQPMADDTGRAAITFNGEIYNHSSLRDELRSIGHCFQSRSDTEVILAAYKEWGTGCLTRLQGAFAFAIYDDSRREIFLGRDRAGEKPLFYYHAQNQFLFASELKALMADPGFPRKLDLDALDQYLAYGSVTGDRAMIQGVRKLRPGHGMIYRRDGHGIRIWQYWDLPANKPDSTLTTNDLVDELHGHMSNSVRRQLVADVPVGILLSGGLDSSLITAYAASVSSQPVRTFTVSFPHDRQLNEGPYAKMVANHFGTQHTELVAEPTSVSLLPQLARQYDEPLADHSIVPTAMLCREVRKSVTVALGGDGGDELFGGYRHYNLLQTIARVRQYVPARLRRLGAATALRCLPIGTRGRNHAIDIGGGAAESQSAINRYFDRVARQELLAPLYRAGFRPVVTAEMVRIQGYDFASTVQQNATRTDFRTTLVDDYLVKTDRASMLHSLEVRAPFLDTEVVEFAFGRVPDRLQATPARRKVLLRLLGARCLPPELDLHRKQGFSLPLRSWFKKDWRPYLESVLADASPDLFDLRIINRLMRGQSRGLANTERLFALLMFELWRREYRVEV